MTDKPQHDPTSPSPAVSGGELGTGIPLTQTVAILRACAEAFDPASLNPQGLVAPVDEDEVMSLEGWDDSVQAWKLKKADGTSIHRLCGQIVDPYMCLRVVSLYNRERRMYTWEVVPYPIEPLEKIKQRADSLMGFE